MKKKEIEIMTKSWSEIKDEVFGKKGYERRDNIEKTMIEFKISLITKKLREHIKFKN